MRHARHRIARVRCTRIVVIQVNGCMRYARHRIARIRRACIIVVNIHWYVGNRSSHRIACIGRTGIVVIDDRWHVRNGSSHGIAGVRGAGIVVIDIHRDMRNTGHRIARIRRTRIVVVWIDRRMRNTGHRIASIRRTCIVVIDGNGGLHGALLHIARSHRTSIAIVSRKVGGIKCRAHAAHTVTYGSRTIVGGLGLEWRTLAREVQPTHASNTGATFAFRIVSNAIGRLITSDTRAHAITEERHVHAAHRSCGQRWIRCHAIAAYIRGAIILIDRKVRIVIDLDDGPIPIALLHLAILGGLRSGWRPGTHERRTADIANARCRNAFIRNSRAIRNGLARHTAATRTASTAHSPNSANATHSGRSPGSSSAAHSTTTGTSHASGTSHTSGTAHSRSSSCPSHSGAATTAATAAGVSPAGTRSNLGSIHFGDHLTPHPHCTHRERGCSKEKLVRPTHRSHSSPARIPQRPRDEIKNQPLRPKMHFARNDPKWAGTHPSKQGPALAHSKENTLRQSTLRPLPLRSPNLAQHHRVPREPSRLRRLVWQCPRTRHPFASSRRPTDPITSCATCLLPEFSRLL